MPGSCAVVGCHNRFVRGGKHFYRFPKNEQLKSLWIMFTRKGNCFEVKKCSAICEDHFAAERVVSKKKGRFYLLKGTVPTVYYRESKEGLEKINVEFDYNNEQYIGQESVNLLRGTVSAQDEKMLVHDRRERVMELKNLCRFCFESQDDKFVAISKLGAYSIDSNEMISLIGIGTQYDDVFSEIVCEQCFQQIVTIDGYRKRCQKAQDDIILEMTELDQKLQDIRTLKAEERPWFKFDESENISDTHQPAHIEIIEEHLDDNISFVGEESDNDFHTEEYCFEDFKVEEDQNTPKSICFKEYKAEPMDESNIIDQSNYDSNFDNEDQDENDENYLRVPESSDKDIYNTTDTDAIIKNPDRNSFALRIYECFFCRLKFAGKKTFKAHDCPVKEVKCEFEGCSKYFNKLSGYNTHVVKVHGLMKTSRHFCSICKSVIMSTDFQFKVHFRHCHKESEKKDSDHPIECEICKRKCPNLKSYTVHKLFHDTRNLIDTNDKSFISLNAKGPVICELCGKEFTNAQGLRTHKKNVHRVGQPDNIVYQCDICSKMRPTKRSLFNHMRNVHRVRETPCNVCGKVFRTPALLQKHMMYHDETKRTHRCALCPDKPGWFTNVALKRHQKSHHQGMKEYVCDAAYCEAAFTTNSMLKQHKANYHSYHL